MFDPSRDDVRRFFCEAWRKQREALPLTPLETIAAHWIVEHPEYHPDLDSLERALAAEYPVEGGRSNPFLHLAMHLSISEQLQTQAGLAARGGAPDHGVPRRDDLAGPARPHDARRAGLPGMHPPSGRMTILLRFPTGQAARPRGSAARPQRVPAVGPRFPHCSPADRDPDGRPRCSDA